MAEADKLNIDSIIQRLLEASSACLIMLPNQHQKLAKGTGNVTPPASHSEHVSETGYTKHILKPADKKLFYGSGGGMGSGRPVTPPRKAKK
ncbi:hypothetical protein fugu_000919 [Takifugu bimaculatus]|uniref:Uncharacterized protein n=1 Tax=Takifugu bimaculatus TaxID=433685 RepID=A0A4Z2CIG3_9TELE|nr:hypothetical protein fugu_000919 [Takifugu bimaculatus]